MNEEKNVSSLNNIDGDWERYKLYVIETLRRLRKEVDDLEVSVKTVLDKINTIENKITALQVKSSLWGLGAGVLGAILMIILKSKMFGG